MNTFPRKSAASQTRSGIRTVEPVSVEELARPMVMDVPEDEVDEREAHLRSQIARQRERFVDLRRQLAGYESALADLQRQLSEQSARATDLQRQVTKREGGLTDMIEFLRRELDQEAARIAELEREIAAHRERTNPNGMFDGHPLTKLARSYRRDPWWPELESIRRISMLHSETLYILRCCAARLKNAIVEVGPYIGGSTIALGRGVQLSGAGPLISIEMGGSYPTHAVPTDDIIRDLKRNVEAYGLTDLVHIMEGFTTQPAIDEEVNRILAGRPVDLLFLDADGNVERDFHLYETRLSPGAVLIFDDYWAEGAPEKQTTVRAWVDSAVASGLVENLGIYRWGTWVGRYWRKAT
jgi:predicted O-methyltransferase YrrM